MSVARFFRRCRLSALTSRAALPVLLTLLTLASRPAAAQHATAEEVPVSVQPRWIDLDATDWPRGTHGWQTNFTYYVGLDPAPHNAGFFGQRLRRDLTAMGGLAPDVTLALNRYRRQKSLFLVERFLFVGTLMVSGADLINVNHSLFPRSEAAFVGLAFASLVSNFWISRHSNAHLQRAVMDYQGSLIPQKSAGWAPHLRPAFGGVAPQRGGGVGVVVGWQL